jgi:membrane fusion protein (multidrug efflux system)
MSENCGKSGKVMALITTISVLVAMVSFAATVHWWMKFQSVQVPKMPPGMGARGLTVVDGVEVVNKPIADTEKYIAKVEPIESVEVVSRIEGVIDKVHFEEGSIVEKGELLFSIEKEPFIAQLNLQKAVMAKAEANLLQAVKYLKRLKSADSRSISETDMESAESSVQQAEAEVQQANAKLDLDKLSLSYTDIKSPLKGKVGKHMFTAGNLVRPTSGILTKIVKMDPVRVVFSATDKDYLRATTMQNKGLISGMKASLLLPDGSEINEGGKWVFVDNEMDSSTGTIAIRVEFPNKERLLIPGGYVKIMISPEDTKEAPVIPQTALMNDKDGCYVFSLTEDDTVQQTRIKVGKRTGTDIIVTNGLVSGARVIVEGLQKVRPNQKVTVNPVLN